MIRPATSDDETAMVELAVVNDMFAADDVDGLVEIFRDSVNTSRRNCTRPESTGLAC